MRFRGLIAGLVLLTVIAAPGRSCGPYSLEMTFVNPSRPDNLKDFVEGRAFAIQTTFYVRSLALAYRIFNGPALTPDEKKGLLATYAVDGNLPEQPQPGLHAWGAAYAAVVGPTASTTPQQTDTAVPGQQWQTYTNCYDDAFATAAHTLADRGKRHPEARPAVLEWAHGQAAVFSNCGALHALPAAAPAAAPLWLQQDRAYQLAAAHLYRNEWQDARSGFAAIAADPASPWRELAAYLVGRTLVRQATLADLPQGSPIDGGVHFDAALMTQAETQMKLVASSHSPFADSASEMLNFIEFHLHPGRAEARVGNFITRPDKHLAQHLIDLREGYDNAWQPEAQRAEAVKSDLFDWLVTMHQPAVGAPGHALTRWRETHTTAWLVAAMVLHHPKNSTLEPDLLAAAQAIPESSPAWPTVTYALLAHQPPSTETFQQLLHARETLLAQHALPSAVNQVTALAIQQAPSLTDFVRLAPMDPAGAQLYDDDFHPLPLPGKNVDPEDTSPGGIVLMAGLPANVAGVKRFDEASAILFNQHLPTAVLAPLVVSSNWPSQLRFEAAMAVWSRAVLLDQPDEARKLTPILIDGEPAWAPFLNAYDKAASPETRHLAGLLALMRYPSVRPYLNAGPTRDTGFAAYSSYRDNWWCANLDAGFGRRDEQQGAGVTLPPFITPEVAAQARAEEARLLQTGDAPRYFGTQALAWVKAHPADPHNAELLHFADRAIRNGCNLELAYDLRQQIRARLQPHPGKRPN